MGESFRRAAIRGAAAAFFLALLPASESLAGLAGSKHDFSGRLTARSGACAPCHSPHSSKGLLLWPRELGEETAYFSQTSNPNYVRGDTILCYDCHDNHGTVDNDPPDSSFPLTRLAQDVAFDDEMKTTAPRDGLPADNKLGYYEKPTTGTAVSGHYVKNPPGGIGINQGDKLPCWDCHDPHDTRNQAFIRRNLADKTLVGVKASSFMAYTEIRDGRDDADSRKFCVACHGTSEQTTETAVTFAMINPGYGGNRIAAPPISVGAHGSASTTACTTCHKHSGTVATCKDCHGGGIAAAGNANIWPDGLAPKGNQYPNRPGWHTRHVEAIAAARFGAAATTAEKNATCDTCHPNPGGAGHDGNTAGSLAGTADVHRDPQNPATHFRNIAGAANGVQTESYNNAATANGKSCQNVDCHYRVATPVKGAATADGDGWFQPLAVATCQNCHGDGTAGTALPGAHPQHVGSVSPQKAYGCWYCHPTGVGNTAYAVGHETGLVEWDFANTLDPGGAHTETYAGLATGATAVKYGTGAFSTCAGVYCHIQTSPAWDGAIGATGCTLCHQTGQTAAPNPSSGLHYGSTPPAVSGAWHDDTLDAVNGCAVCHTSARAQGTHVDGTFNGGAGAGDVARMGLFSAYTQTADGAGTCSGAAVSAAGCHDGGDGGGWSRLWNASFHYATNGDECRGCHGGFGLSTETPAYGWRFGTGAHDATDGSTEHAYNWDGDAGGPEVMASHKVCKVCHGASSATDTHANYVAGAGFWRGKAGDTTSMHGDGSIQLNGPSPSVGAGYDQTIWGCSNVPACHGSEWVGGTYPSGAGHRLEESGWPVATVDFGGAVCDTCHGYPPTGAETPTPFLDHGSRSPGASSGEQFLGAHNDCSTCHGVRGNTNSPPDGFVYTDLTAQGGDAYTAALHRDGSVQVNGISAPDNRQNADYQTASGGCARACHAATWKIAASYPTTYGKSIREFGSGSCEVCHGGGIAAEGNVNSWPDGLAPKGSQYPNRPGWHTRHVNAVAAVRYGAAATTEEKNTTCDTCHPNPGGAGHDGNTAGSPPGTADVHRDPQNQATHFKDIAGAANGVLTESYDNAATANGKSCQNVDCHYRVATPVKGAATADGDGWFQPLAVATCQKCHGDGTAGAPLPDAHPRHVGAISPQKAYGCWFCHPTGVAYANYTMSHQTGAVEWDFANTLDPGGAHAETYAGLATGTTPVKYGSGALSTCAAAYCHIQTSPPWDGAIGAAGCTLCHQTGQTAAPDPSSGLHYGSAPPAVSGTVHDDTLDAVNGCAVCHTSVRAQGTHVDGAFNGGAAAGDAGRMGLFSAYTQTADGAGACFGAAVSAAGCHDRGDGGTWSRLWDASSHYATNGNECRGCHGGFGLSTDTPAYGWTFGAAHSTTDGSAEHAYNWDGDADGSEVMTRHRICKTCHGANSASDTHPNYVAGTGFWRGKAGDTTSMHGDGEIQLNGPAPAAGAGYSTASRGCDNAGCHGGAASQHNLEASGWPVAAVDFGGAACDGCHGYPPTGTETPTPFLAHGSRSPGATGDAAFLSAHADCATCHGVRGNTNSPPDAFVYTDLTAQGGDAYVAALHMDGSVQVNGISSPDGRQNADYQAANGGCARACHAATWKLDASYPTAAGTSPMEFGSGLCESCHDGTVALAPNVMTSWSGSTASQDGGHGDPDGAPALACVDCHDLGLPAAPDSARHGTGTYNSLWGNNATRSSNTSHLKAGYFTEFPANEPGDWSIQVAIDNYCTWKCHDLNRNGVHDLGEPAATMRHSGGDVASGGANEWSVEFGTHLTGPPFSEPGDADRNVPVPIDIDMTTEAAGGKEYAPCTSCHDPHGTSANKLGAGRSNLMLRFTNPLAGNTILCSKCHI